jgi:hypothetical protein
MQPPGIIKVRAGKIVNPTPRKAVQTPKSTFVRQLIFQFNCAIERDARLLVKFRKRGQLTSHLESLIEGVYSEIVSVIRAFPPTGNRIPKAFNNQIQQLEKVNEHFINNIQSELFCIGTERKRVGFILSWLAVDIQHFTQNFNATYSSIAVEFSEHGEILPPSWRHIPNRSSDQERKKKFKEVIENWRVTESSPNKYPRHKVVQLYMNRAGFKFPDRTYRLYKLQIKNGTFDNFIQ